jgi:ribosomal protein L37E
MGMADPRSLGRKNYTGSMTRAELLNDLFLDWLESVTPEPKPPPKPSECVHKHTKRISVGPTGRKHFMVPVDECYSCGYQIPARKLSYKERDWLDRWNARLENERVRT